MTDVDPLDQAGIAPSGSTARWVVFSALICLSLKELIRRRDAYVALILSAAILVPLGGVNVFGIEGAIRHLREIALMLVWLFSIVIAVVTAARQIPVEIEQRTLYPLLARPVRRSDIVVGKALGAITASKLCLALFYLLFIGLSVWKGAALDGLALLQAFCLHAVFLAMVTTLVVAGSTVLTRSANMTFSVLIVAGMLLFGGRLAGWGAEGGIARVWTAVHWLAPHFELFDMRYRLIHEWGPLPPGAWLQLCLYGLAYAGALLIVACALFRRKTL